MTSAEADVLLAQEFRRALVDSRAGSDGSRWIEELCAVIRKARLQERAKIANYVETSKRFDNASLARDIRKGEYR